MLLGHELAEILLNFTLNRSDLDPARCWSLENGRPFIEISRRRNPALQGGEARRKMVEKTGGGCGWPPPARSHVRHGAGRDLRLIQVLLDHEELGPSALST